MAGWLERTAREYRGRLIVAGACWFLVVGLFSVLGAMTAYTMLWGETTTARVAKCDYEVEREGRPGDLVCTGTWRTGAGTQESGFIEGVDQVDVGRDETVRLGPGGDAYAGSITDHPIAFAPLVLVLTVVFYLWFFWRVRRADRVDPLFTQAPDADMPTTGNVRVIPGGDHTDVGR
ncbi:hypothetical protein E1264_13805 [Actinomadura sp. KC216]|uniref:hypothetical protein n=1 Tax=Actinomadura sp. KC216 TaxID=2530370 RepID=UPI0010454C93|nr:hypothetical protein [Actinomadura sp. KC216]TDB87717.1 hypothetical protein E1264_13805 [Actinomadura sp. KC216]